VSDSLEPCRSVSLLEEPCLLPKHDNELLLEPLLELVLEFDLEANDIGRSRVRGASSPIASPSVLDHIAVPKCDSMGESIVSLIWYRSFALRLAHLEDAESGDSLTNTGPREFEFVFAFDNLLCWLAVLWLLPMVSRCGTVRERQRPNLTRTTHKCEAESSVSVYAEECGVASDRSIPIGYFRAPRLLSWGLGKPAGR
jgi:hypothetical protein